MVTALGLGVTAPHIGERVLAMAEEGGYAEAVALPADQCHRLPPRMSFLEAASLSLAYDTAWFALRERARLLPGETVLVLGASGAVGHAAVQLARAVGARVLAGISRPEKAAAARAAGADTVIDLSRENLRNALREEVWAATDGRGADVILDPLGGDACAAAPRALAWCGRLVVIGYAAGPIPTVRTNYLLVKNIEVSGLQVSDYRTRRPQVAACFAEIFDPTCDGDGLPARPSRRGVGSAARSACRRPRRLAPARRLNQILDLPGPPCTHSATILCRIRRLSWRHQKNCRTSCSRPIAVAR